MSVGEGHDPTLQGAEKAAGCPAALETVSEFALAVDAAVLSLGLVGELEDGSQLLLGGGDAAGVLAVQNALQLHGQVQLLLFDGLAVGDDGDGDAGVHEA